MVIGRRIQGTSLVPSLYYNICHVFFPTFDLQLFEKYVNTS